MYVGWFLFASYGEKASIHNKAKVPLGSHQITCLFFSGVFYSTYGLHLFVDIRKWGRGHIHHFYLAGRTSIDPFCWTFFVHGLNLEDRCLKDSGSSSWPMSTKWRKRETEVALSVVSQGLWVIRGSGVILMWFGSKHATWCRANPRLGGP